MTDCWADAPGTFEFKGPGGMWLLVFNCRSGVLLDPGMARMWDRGGRVRHDSPDGRAIGLVVPCAGRGLKGPRSYRWFRVTVRFLGRVLTTNDAQCSTGCRHCWVLFLLGRSGSGW